MSSPEEHFRVSFWIRLDSSGCDSSQSGRGVQIAGGQNEPDRSEQAAIVVGHHLQHRTSIIAVGEHEVGKT